MNHDQNRQIGIVEGIRIQGGKLLGRLRLASDQQSQEILQDIKDGIRQNLSIGYQVLRSYFDDMGRKIVDKFRVMEVSLVAIPADKNAGIGRSFEIHKEDGNFFLRHYNEVKPMENEKTESRSQKRSERERASEILALAKHHD